TFPVPTEPHLSQSIYFLSPLLLNAQKLSSLPSSASKLQLLFHRLKAIPDLSHISLFLCIYHGSTRRHPNHFHTLVQNLSALSYSVADAAHESWRGSFFLLLLFFLPFSSSSTKIMKGLKGGSIVRETVGGTRAPTAPPLDPPLLLLSQEVDIMFLGFGEAVRSLLRR
ncbi:unnamed protein product, partial [Urochloa humidicola]